MERIYLKPTATEILHKDSGKEGHLDLFAYDSEADDSRRKLGNLYLVGNVHPALAGKGGVQMPGTTGEAPASENDVTYVTNLVASLAKREYYSNPDLAPKEAFSLALKKINDVIGEFFTNKDIRINIGIFAIAGEQINISKLGKFKIILSREDKNIDILNNVDLFTKERVQEKEFSHVISGKVTKGDKIFAYYPGRLITAREKYLKEYLLKLNGEQIVEKLNTIKEEKPDFSCAAVYIDLEKSKEPALTPKAKAAPAPEPETEAEASSEVPAVQLTSKKVKELFRTVTVEEEPAEPDLPRIIRSEFSLGKKLNIIQAAFNKVRPFMPRFHNKLVLFLTLIGIIIAVTVAVKSLFLLSPAERQAASAIEQARDSLKLAKTKISQNDILGARQILSGSLGSLAQSSSDKTEEARIELLETLDSIDQATEVSPALVDMLPDGLHQKVTMMNAQSARLQANEFGINSPVAFDIYEDNLYALAGDSIVKVSDVTKSGKKQAESWLKSGTLPPNSSMVAVDGRIYTMNDSGVLAVYYRGEKTGEYNTFILSGNKGVLATTKDSKNLYLINKDLGRIYILSKDNGSLVRTLKVSVNGSFNEAYLDQDETVYFTTEDNKTWKVK